MNGQKRSWHGLLQSFIRPKGDIDLILFTDIVRNTATVKHDGILVHSLVPAGCNIGISFAIRSFVYRCIARDVYSGIHCIVVFSGVAVNIYNDNLFSVKEIALTRCTHARCDSPRVRALFSRTEC